MSDNKKTCFVISPIGPEGSPIRRHADLVFKHIIEPAVKQAGYDKVQRADHDPTPSIITNTIIQHIDDDDLVVAVLTGNNPNVFYELCYRHSIRKPCVHLIDKKYSAPPFDVGAINMIKYDITDWDSPEKAIKELHDAIKIAEQSKTIVNPISSAIAIKRSLSSEDLETKNTAIVAEQMQQMLNEMRQINASVQRNVNSLNQRATYSSLATGPRGDTGISYVDSILDPMTASGIGTVQDDITYGTSVIGDFDPFTLKRKTK